MFREVLRKNFLKFFGSLVFVEVRNNLKQHPTQLLEMG